MRVRLKDLGLHHLVPRQQVRHLAPELCELPLERGVLVVALGQLGEQHPLEPLRLGALLRRLVLRLLQPLLPRRVLGIQQLPRLLELLH